MPIRIQIDEALNALDRDVDEKELMSGVNSDHGFEFSNYHAYVTGHSIEHWAYASGEKVVHGSRIVALVRQVVQVLNDAIRGQPDDRAQAVLAEYTTQANAAVGAFVGFRALGTPANQFGVKAAGEIRLLEMIAHDFENWELSSRDGSDPNVRQKKLLYLVKDK